MISVLVVVLIAAVLAVLLVSVLIALLISVLAVILVLVVILVLIAVVLITHNTLHFSARFPMNFNGIRCAEPDSAFIGMYSSIFAVPAHVVYHGTVRLCCGNFFKKEPQSGR